ncbi:MAG: CDP-archaeol synthase [Candidatus Woesearchaeota archaeon]
MMEPQTYSTSITILPILLLLLKSVYFLIPAYFANMAPPLAKKFKIFELFNVPIDNDKKWKDARPVFGHNKTYRGFIVGAIGGLIGAFLQMFLYRYDFFKTISILGINYNLFYIVVFLGILMGLGAITGDLIESFFKRRLNIDSGKSFVPWDQIDLVIGAYIFVLPIAYLYLTWQIFLISVIISFFLHVITNHIAFYLNIRKEKW